MAATAAALALAAGPAAAHIQVRPSEAAPLDPTLWTVLVPNERNVPTTKIELQVPKGVVPFSFQDAPGWRRTVTLAPDKSIATIVWRGRLPEQGLALFTFLGTTPDREGRLAWKAIQTYGDGKAVRWIGPPDSEEPGSYTTVSKSNPRQNAGGEGAGDESSAATPASTPVRAAESGDDGGGGSTLALVLGAVALLTAIAALAHSVRRSARAGDSGS